MYRNSRLCVSVSVYFSRRDYVDRESNEKISYFMEVIFMIINTFVKQTWCTHECIIIRDNWLVIPNLLFQNLMLLRDVFVINTCPESSHCWGVGWYEVGPDWKIGQRHSRFFSRYKFLRPWKRQFFMGENFRAPECPFVFCRCRATCIHSARLYHGRHNWIK